VLKPPEMLPADPKDPSESDSKEPSATAGRASQASVAKSDMEDDSFKGQTSANREEDYEPAEFDDYWPPVRERIHCITIRVISLHNLPKRGEHRPRWFTSRGACHAYASDLSGTEAPPNNKAVSSPSISMGIHPAGGFCTLTETLPPSPNAKTELRSTSAAEARGGMNASFNATIHCIVSEPRTTFLRIAVTDRGQEVAYETAVLGRLRRGYRVLQMRSKYGTRIELCYVLVHIRFERQPNDWITPRQKTKLRKYLLMSNQEASPRRSTGLNELELPLVLGELTELRDENAMLKDRLERMTQEERTTQEDPR